MCDRSLGGWVLTGDLFDFAEITDIFVVTWKRLNSVNHLGHKGTRGLGQVAPLRAFVPFLV
jgi:hypothetical protein